MLVSCTLHTGFRSGWESACTHRLLSGSVGESRFHLVVPASTSRIPPERCLFTDDHRTVKWLFPPMGSKSQPVSFANNSRENLRRMNLQKSRAHLTPASKHWEVHSTVFHYISLTNCFGGNAHSRPTGSVFNYILGKNGVPEASTPPKSGKRESSRAADAIAESERRWHLSGRRGKRAKIFVHHHPIKLPSASLRSPTFGFD